MLAPPKMNLEAQNQGDKDFRSTTRDVRRLIKELQAEKIDGLVLDLRGNGGGYLPEATALTGLFIDKGPVVMQRSAAQRRKRLMVGVVLIAAVGGGGFWWTQQKKKAAAAQAVLDSAGQFA